MYLLESQPHLVPILRRYERRVYGGLYRFCRTCWQHASSHTCRKYPRFAMARSEFERGHDRWNTSDEFHLSLDESIQVLHLATSLEDVCSGKPTPQVAGRLLRAASYGMCMLGGRASPGDVEMHLLRLKHRPHWPEDVAHPYYLLKWYREGNALPLALFLNRRLERASVLVRRLRESRKCAFTEISVFAYDDARNQHGLDTDIVGTDYLLLTSLLKLVEHQAGHA